MTYATLIGVCVPFGLCLLGAWIVHVSAFVLGISFDGLTLKEKGTRP
jgi:hypothetical protein